MRIEFTSTDESWLIAISESSQAANTSGASPAGRKREADGDREKKKIFPLFSPLSLFMSPRLTVRCIISAAVSPSSGLVPNNMF